MASVVLYGNFVDQVSLGNIDWDNDTINCALLDANYTPDKDNDTLWADVNADEVSGTGYTAGGETLTTKTKTYDSASDTWAFDADDVEWASSTITARWGVLYDATHADEPLIAYVDFDAERSSSEGMFRIAWNSAGIFEATV